MGSGLRIQVGLLSSYLTLYCTWALVFPVLMLSVGLDHCFISPINGTLSWIKIKKKIIGFLGKMGKFVLQVLNPLMFFGKLGFENLLSF